MKYIQLHELEERVKTLCPFHEEKTPSMIIDFKKKTFHCFGCGKEGQINGVVILEEQGK